MAQSIANKYRRLIVETDEHLRKQNPNGTRVHVEYRNLAEEMNVGASTMSSVLTFLSSITGSGLTRVKGAGGKYEYMLPAGYPDELAALKADMRTASTRARIMNPNVRADVIAFFKKHPNEVQTISEVAEEVDGNRNSVGNAMLKLSKAGWLQARPDIGAGCYIYHSSTVEEPPETPDDDEDSAPSARSIQAEQENLTRERAAELEVLSGRQAGKTLAPSPARVAAQVQARKTEEVVVAVAANYPPDDELYEFVQMTKRSKIVLRNRATGALGYWEEM